MTRSRLFKPPAQGWAALHACMARLEAFRDVEFEVASQRQPVWVSISGRPRFDAQGKVIGYEGVGRDVSERKSAHQRLVASEQRWSMMARLAVRLVLADRRRTPAAAAVGRAAAAHRRPAVRAHRRAHPLGGAPRRADCRTMGRAPRRPRRAPAVSVTAARSRGRRRPLCLDLAQRRAALRCAAPLSSATTASAVTSAHARKPSGCCCAITRSSSARSTNAPRNCSS